MSSSSSRRSTVIPLSFDRFRVKSIQFLSPFRNHHCDIRIKQSPERSCIRKIQVHPNEVKSSEFKRIDHDAAYLFHANKYSNSKTSSLSTIPQNKKSSNYFYTTRSTSNVTTAFDVCKLPVTNASHPSQSNVFGCTCPPTPCMIRYRHSSLPSLIPTRVVKFPKTFDDSIKHSDFDQFNA